MGKTIGVLALQGAFQAHRAHIEALGCAYMEVRSERDLGEVDALILPGGESTTMLKLLDRFEMTEALAKTPLPLWGICAGAILLAKKVTSPEQFSFARIDIEIERNSYGRQNESFRAEANDYPVVYIRAPRIGSAGARVEILSEEGGSPTWVREGRVMATTFHPELTPQTPSPMHAKFLSMI